MRVISKILQIFRGIIIAVIVLSVGIHYIPLIFGISSFIVTSGSMEPAIHTGAVAYVNMKDKDFEPGDVVVYETSDGTGVLHRIDSYDPDEKLFYMKGDANDVVDANPVSRDQIKGVFLFSIPHLGIMLAQMQMAQIQIGPLSLNASVIILVGLLLLVCILEAVFSKEDSE